MNELTIFKNDEFGEVRTIVIDGKPYFGASDVAKVLGYTNPRDAISRHCKGVVKSDIPTNSGIQTVSFIPEGDIYRLIVKSKLPSAERFETWVMDEVLPSIRKHGAYMTEQTIEKVLTSPDFIIQLATQLKKEQEARKIAERTIEEQKPLVDFAKHITESSDTVDVGEFAKIVKNEKIDIGRNRLFEWLRTNKYLMNNNVPYQKYINNNFFKVIEITKSTAYGTKVFSKTLITGKGQVVLVEQLRQEFGLVA